MENLFKKTKFKQNSYKNSISAKLKFNNLRKFSITTKIKRLIVLGIVFEKLHKKM